MFKITISAPKWRRVQRIALRFLLILILALLFIADQPETALADTPVCGQITADTIWASANNNYIVTCDVQVAIGVKLTIQPGTVVKFDLNTAMIINGELVADGVTFTSNDPSPAAGDWEHIFFSSTSVDAVYDDQGNYVDGSVIQNSLLKFGGGSPALGVIEVSFASPYLKNNTIQEIYGIAVGVFANGRSPNQPITIAENNISDPTSHFENGIEVTNGLALSNTISSIGDWGIVATNSTLIGNMVTGGGIGGISIVGGTVTGNTVSANSGTGIDASGSMILNNFVSGNAGGVVSGCAGIWAKGNSVVTGNIVSNNSNGASGGYGSGGGICAEGGIISNNTVSGNSSVAHGGGVFSQDAIITNNTITGNSAPDGGGIYGDNSSLSDNFISNNSATNEGGGIHMLLGSSATNNIVEENTAVYGGGIYTVVSSSATGNSIFRNSANMGAGIYAEDSSLIGNTVISNTAQIEGGGLYLKDGFADSNAIALNKVPSFGHGSGAYLQGQVSFTYNDVVTNSAQGGIAGGIAINGMPTTIQLNNIYNNSPYDAEVVSANDVDGTLNYWGPSSCVEIAGQVYDGDDVPGLGILLYAPSLYIPTQLPQLESPTNLEILSSSMSEVTLSWSGTAPIPNIGCRDPQMSGPDSGYYIYYDTDSACEFDGQGLSQGNSPIYVGQATSLTLTGLSNPGTYYFVVTADDYLSRESPFSNLVNFSTGGIQIFLPNIKR